VREGHGEGGLLSETTNMALLEGEIDEAGACVGQQCVYKARQKSVFTGFFFMYIGLVLPEVFYLIHSPIPCPQHGRAMSLFR
jgi:hypothetical protein